MIFEGCNWYSWMFYINKIFFAIFSRTSPHGPQILSKAVHVRPTGGSWTGLVLRCLIFGGLKKFQVSRWVLVELVITYCFFGEFVDDFSFLDDLNMSDLKQRARAKMSKAQSRAGCLKVASLVFCCHGRLFHVLLHYICWSLSCPTVDMQGKPTSTIIVETDVFL